VIAFVAAQADTCPADTCPADTCPADTCSADKYPPDKYPQASVFRISYLTGMVIFHYPASTTRLKHLVTLGGRCMSELRFAVSRRCGVRCPALPGPAVGSGRTQ